MVCVFEILVALSRLKQEMGALYLHIFHFIFQFIYISIYVVSSLLTIFPTGLATEMMSQLIECYHVQLSIRCTSKKIGAKTSLILSNTLVGNSNDPPRKISESLYCIIIYFCILGNNKRPIDLLRIVKTGRKWSKLVKTGQNWSKLVESGQNWSKLVMTFLVPVTFI